MKRKGLYNSKCFCYFFLLTVLTIFLSSCEEQPEDITPWKELFDTKTFAGWTQMGGEAIYEIRYGTIVGSTVANTPNSFLVTNNLYDDFILELEYKVDSSMNSGIQIRSNSFPHYMNGMVHGYQIEIDPSSRAWSAGIFDEGRRGWLHPILDENMKAKLAFKQNEWNHYRIEAIGDTIKTWINAVPASHLVDDQTSQGFIGLQVHSIEGAQKAGTQIVWRNIRILTEDLETYSRKSSLPLLDTSIEADQSWNLLWDGETTNS